MRFLRPRRNPNRRPDAEPTTATLMSASPLKFLRAGPPPPKVVLLPDGLFFSRVVPVLAGATAAEAASQIELALEANSPFPLAQLYYGWYWVLGAETAFVYAAYRRRFTSEQTAEWAEAELVIPASAALFGGVVQPATTLLLTAPDGLTAVHWEDGAVPSRVSYRPLSPEATDDERTQVRDAVVRSFGGSITVVDLLVPPTVDAGSSDREMVFRSGDFTARVPATVAAAMDVRDKGDLLALRTARKRDLILWRVALGAVAALLLLLLGELALLGGQAWQKVRLAEVRGRAPAVERIMHAQELATNVQDLVVKRFLPVEMLTTIMGADAERKPRDLVVTSIRSSAAAANRGSYTLVLEMHTTNPGQVPAYRQELQKLPQIENVNVEPTGSRGDQSLFRVTVTFKPGSLKPDTA